MEAYAARRARLREQMLAAGVGHVIVYSDGRHSCFEPEPILYFSGFKPFGPHTALFLSMDDQPALLVTPEWDRARARTVSGLMDVAATNEFCPRFADAVERRGLARARVGIMGRKRLSRSMRDAMQRDLRSPLVPFDGVFDGLAGVRDDLELRLSRQAAAIAERGYQHLLGRARPGMREFELAAEVESYMRSLGADDNFQMISASLHHRAVRAPADRRLDAGDVVLAEISPSVGGQFAQICRSAMLGPASELHRERYDLLVEAMLAGMGAGVPGVRVRDVVQAVNDVLGRAGYGEYCAPPYMRVRGHGLGLGSIVPGDLTLENETVLESGMTFVLHPNQYLPEVGYLLVGEPVVVTESGLQPLTHGRPTLDSVPA